MKLNKKHKQFIKKLKQQSPCTITPEDIYKNTDFFNNKQPESKPSYKLAFMVSLVLVFISLTLTTILSIQNHNLKTKEPEKVYIYKESFIIDDTQGMPKEEKDKLTLYLSDFNANAVASYVHNKDVLFYLYYGYNINSDNSKTYYYYYAFSGIDDYIPPFYLSINNATLTITSDNRYGLLTTLNTKETSDFTINFIVETDDRKCEYVLKNCDF